MRLHLPQLFLVGLRCSFAGNVFLIGAGPGDPELLTVKAVRILREADLVLHDDLVSPAILSLVSSSTRVVNVGRRCGTRGVTAACAAAAAAHVALTDRRLGSTLVVLPGHRAPQNPPPDWRAARALRATVADYMPGRRYASVVCQLAAAGFAADTPCLAVSRATTPEEHVRRARLDELPEVEVPAPSLLLVAPPRLEGS
jgi:uroporphyrin-III C-methyltransferase